MGHLFIVFEGIDGSGTTTQANLLKEYFTKQSVKALVTSEPSEGPIGHFIRQAMKGRIFFTKDQSNFDRQMAYLFAADRHDHLYNEVDGVFKKLAEGYHVISTRYVFSSYAYHCNHADDFQFVRNLNEAFPNPDLVIYIDNPLEVSMERINRRTVKEVYETENKLVKVKENYDKIFSNYTGKLLKVDGRKDRMEIHREIITFVQENLSQ